VTDGILILVENEPYPYDRRVRQEAVALVEAGYPVTVVSPKAPNASEAETEIEGVRVLRFDALPQGRGGVAYLREYLLAALRMRRIVTQLRDEQFAAVIACNPPDFLIQLARPLARRGAALIFDLHDPSPELFESKFGRRGLVHRALRGLERWGVRTADVVMTVNDPCAELVRTRDGVAAERVAVLVTCPDPRRLFEVAPRAELKRGKRQLVLWLGRMSEKENLPLLLEAAERVVHDHGRTDVAFAIVGRGEVADELAAEIEHRRLGDNVFLPGQADDELLRQWLSTADVCVSLDTRSAMNDRSTMIKVLEYMAAGRPVVQFPLTEMSRICGEAALYAADGDAADLAAKIELLLDDPALRRRLGEQARTLVAEQLGWAQQVPILLAAVEQAIALRRSRVDGALAPAGS
jgi:glycosyltransferase involved in cell wall biosynthesis